MSLADELAERLGLQPTPEARANTTRQTVVVDVDDLAAWLIKRGVGSRGGRRRSRKERPEAPELGATSRRFARALASRAAEGDTEGLEQLVEVGRSVQDATASAVRSLHGFGYSWAEIADVLGVTKQAAQQRYGKRLGEEET